MSSGIRPGGEVQAFLQDGEPLCLVVKHVDGPLAICIDSQVPSLHMVARSAVQYRAGNDPDIAGTCIAGEEELPIINLTTLGSHRTVLRDESCLV